MSDNEDIGGCSNESGKISYLAEYDKRGTAGCKKCKQKLVKGQLRLGKAAPNPFSDKPGDTMKTWYHVQCMFETLQRARATTKKIESPDDLDGFSSLEDDDQKLIEQHIAKFCDKKGGKKPAKAQSKIQATISSPKSVKTESAPTSSKKPQPASASSSPAKAAAGSSSAEAEEELSFRTFRKLCAELADEAGYNNKTKIVREFLQRGLTGKGYRGNVRVLLGLLLPQESNAVYNLKDKQLVKLFSSLFNADEEEMLADLGSSGDASETIRKFFENSSSNVRPAAQSTLSQTDVADWLSALCQYTKADDQKSHLSKIAKKSTANDLKLVVRLIKKDIRINAGAKHILEGLDSSAYDAYCALQDLDAVVEKFYKRDTTKAVVYSSELLKPVSPMLASQCRSTGEALQKCPKGLFVEIKYDGERVQLHKQGKVFKFFSRNLKPVQEHKVSDIKSVIADAFPGVKDVILDSEVLVVDKKTSKPLPFGTLGIHKKIAAGADACTCMFVFDILHLDGKDLSRKPLKERREILKGVLKEVKNRVMIAEYELATKKEEIEAVLVRVFKENLEGLVLKDSEGIYEPGKRHWLKMKRDYLGEGSMADSADLIVLGAYYGTGQKGGLMSTFLMGAYDAKTRSFCTVTKVGNGLDLQTLHSVQSQIEVEAIQKDVKKVPSWLKVSRSLVPDFVVKDPKKAPVWEIVGAEFTKSTSHTAAGISIRFPRVTRFRDDKSWKEANDVARLAELYELSKKNSDVRIEQLVKASASPVGSPRKKFGAGALSSPNSSKNLSTPSSASSNASSPSSSPAKPGSSSATPTKRSRDDSFQSPATRKGLNSPAKRSRSPPATVPKKKAKQDGKKKATGRRFVVDDSEEEEEDYDDSSEEEASESESESESESDDDDVRVIEDEENGSSRKRKPWLNAPDRAAEPDSKRTKLVEAGNRKEKVDGKQKTSNPALPDVFTGMCFDLSELQPDHAKQVETYIVAYDGEVHSAKNETAVTHVVLPEGKTASVNRGGNQTGKKVETVSLDWFLDCIRQQRLVE